MDNIQQARMIDLEQTSSAAFRTDPQGAIVLWNQAFSKRFPKLIETIKESRERRQSLPIVSSERPCKKQSCQYIEFLKADTNCKAMYITLDGMIYELCGFEEINDVGEILSYTYIVCDQPVITDTPITDTMINVARKIIDDLNMGILYINSNRQVIKINPMACELFQVNPDLWLLGDKSLESIISRDTEEYKVIKKILSSTNSFRNYLVNWERNGELKHVLIDSYTIKDDQGMNEGTCILLKDVGNFISLEQQIQRNDKLATVGKIAAGIAHEIRNPLTSIKGFLQIMHDDHTSSGMDRYRTFTEVMLTEIDRINGLVSELLMLSKPNNIKFQFVDIIHIINNLSPIIQSQALLHNVELKFLLSDIPQVYGDTEMLKQVFINLMKNAIEAMPNGGTLTVGTAYDANEQFVHIDFHDTGSGIPYYIIDRIFDAFYTTKENGTGLGLSICQKIVNDLGGTIRVSSKGFGSTFSVILPTKSTDNPLKHD